LVIESFGEMMDSLDWIEPKAKEKAHEKIVNILKNFGWPEELYGNFKVKLEINIL
jgi:predicted metalloendopeptidase